MTRFPFWTACFWTVMHTYGATTPCDAESSGWSRLLTVGYMDAGSIVGLTLNVFPFVSLKT